MPTGPRRRPQRPRRCSVLPSPSGRRLRPPAPTPRRCEPPPPLLCAPGGGGKGPPATRRNASPVRTSYQVLARLGQQRQVLDPEDVVKPDEQRHLPVLPAPVAHDVTGAVGLASCLLDQA